MNRFPKKPSDAASSSNKKVQGTDKPTGRVKQASSGRRRSLTHKKKSELLRDLKSYLAEYLPPQDLEALSKGHKINPMDLPREVIENIDPDHIDPSLFTDTIAFDGDNHSLEDCLNVVKKFGHIVTEFTLKDTDFSLTDESLRHILICCPNLTTLDLNNTKITGAAFEGLQLLNLTLLDLNSCLNIADNTLRHILTCSPNLTTLDLINTNITGAAFKGIELKNIIELKFNASRNLTDEGLRYILICCPNLMTLDVGFTEITGAALENIELQNLTNLNLNNCRNLTDETLRHALICYPNLMALNVSMTRITGTAFQGLQLKKLFRLTFNSCDHLTDEGLKLIRSACPKAISSSQNTVQDSGKSTGQLEQSSPGQRRNLSPPKNPALLQLLPIDLILYLAGYLPLEDLKALRMASGHKVTPLYRGTTHALLKGHKINPMDLPKEVIENIDPDHIDPSFFTDTIAFDARKHSLEDCLDVVEKLGHIVTEFSSDVYGATSADHPNNISHSTLRYILERCPNLTKLILNRVYITGNSFLRIPNPQKLTEIRFDACSKLSERFLRRAFTRFPNLKALSLRSTDITGVEFKGLQLQKLTLLNLSSCPNLTDEGLRHILICCPNLATLNLPSTKIRGAAFKDLQRQKLTLLDIGGCFKLTYKTLRYILTCCPNLTTLDLERTEITGSEFEGLQLLKLTNLNLDSCRKLTDEGLSQALICGPKLTELNLMRTKITGSAFEGIELQKLTKLSLNGCPNISDESLKLIQSACPNADISV